MNTKVRNLLLLSLVLSVPVFLSLETWQAFRYRELEREVAELMEKQREWIETNKKVLANIALFRSPERIEKLALEEFGLVEIDPDKVLHIEVTGEQE